MFTSRGYRQTKRENKHYSRQGQIIQQKPVFQIDNNPAVLEAYKNFILGGEILLRPIKLKDTYNCTLSEFNLSWTSSTLIGQIQTQLVEFAKDMFTRMQSLKRYPISLELSFPNLSEDNRWAVCYQYSGAGIPYVNVSYDTIIIDRDGTLSYTQYGGGYLINTTGSYQCTSNNLTLGYGLKNSTQRSYGNPTTMQVEIYYFPFFS